MSGGHVLASAVAGEPGPQRPTIGGAGTHRASCAAGGWNMKAARIGKKLIETSSGWLWLAALLAMPVALAIRGLLFVLRQSP
jgi:hypothetical protein